MSTPVTWDVKESEVAVVDLEECKNEWFVNAGQAAADALEEAYDKHCDLLLTSPHRGRQLELSPDLRYLRIEGTGNLYIVYKAVPGAMQVIPVGGVLVPSYGKVLPGHGIIVILRILWSNGPPKTCIV